MRLSVERKCILDVCPKWNKSFMGFCWRFTCPEEEGLREVGNEVSEEELKRRIRENFARPVLADKAVVVLDKDSGKALRYYESVREAAVCLNISQSSIIKVCQKIFVYQQIKWMIW